MFYQAVVLVPEHFYFVLFVFNACLEFLAGLLVASPVFVLLLLFRGLLLLLLSFLLALFSCFDFCCFHYLSHAFASDHGVKLFLFLRCLSFHVCDFAFVLFELVVLLFADCLGSGHLVRLLAAMRVVFLCGGGGGGTGGADVLVELVAGAGAAVVAWPAAVLITAPVCVAVGPFASVATGRRWPC